MKNYIFIGSLFSLLSALSYSVQTSVIKVDVNKISIPVLVFMQSLICLFLIVPIIWIKYGSQCFNIAGFSNVKIQHTLRTIFSLGISYFLFAALITLPYFDAILLFNSFPLFIPVLGLIILSTSIKYVLWPFMILGFIGVFLTLKSINNLVSLDALLAISSAVLTSASIIMMRKISAVDDSLKSLYFYFLLSTLIAGVVAIPYWDINIINAWQQLLIIGVLFFFVQYFLTLAIMYTNAVVVSNLYYSNVIFSLLIAFYLFGEHLNGKVILGMVLIVVGGVGVIVLQRKKHKVAS